MVSDDSVVDCAEQFRAPLVEAVRLTCNQVVRYCSLGRFAAVLLRAAYYGVEPVEKPVIRFCIMY